MHHTSTTNSASTTKPQTLANASYRPTTGENAQPPFASSPLAAPPFAPASPSKLHILLRKFSSKKILPLATATFTLLSLATYTTLQTQTETTSLSHISRNLGGNCWKVQKMTADAYEKLKTEDEGRYAALVPFRCPKRDIDGECSTPEELYYYRCNTSSLYLCVEGGTFQECDYEDRRCPRLSGGADAVTCVYKYYISLPSFERIRYPIGKWEPGLGREPYIDCPTRAHAVGSGVCTES